MRGGGSAPAGLKMVRCQETAPGEWEFSPTGRGVVSFLKPPPDEDFSRLKVIGRAEAGNAVFVSVCR